LIAVDDKEQGRNEPQLLALTFVMFKIEVEKMDKRGRFPILERYLS
jgi:hypothetical protein